MIFSYQKIFLIIGFAVSGAFYLIPEKTEVMSRVLEDGDRLRAIEMIGEKPNAATIVRLVREYSNTKDEKILENVANLLGLVDKPGEVLRVIRRNTKLFDESQKRKFCDSLANRAFEMSDPATALSTYSWLSRTETLNISELRKAITSSRYCGKQQVGINLVDRNLLQRKMEFEDLPNDLRTLMVTLNREINHGPEALELLKRELKLAHKLGEKWKILDQLAMVSVQSDMVKESLPILEEYVQETEVARLSLNELLHREKPHKTDSKFLKFGKTLAQNQEWNMQTENAFQYYQKLAFLGDEYCLERCFALFDWLQEYEGMATLLDGIPLETLSFAQHMSFAFLVADSADYRKAETLFSSALDRPEPDPGEVFYNRGMVILAQGRFDECIRDFELAIENDPGRVHLREKIASIHNTRGRHKEALASFRSLPIETHSHSCLDEYQTLATTLGSDSDLLVIGRHLVKSGHGHDASNFLELGELLFRSGSDEEALEVIDAGLIEFPDSANLQLAKIDHLMQIQEFEKAFVQFKNSFDSNQDDTRYHLRAFGLARELTDSHDVLGLLELEDPLAEDWDSFLRIELALLYEQLDRLEDAHAICSSCDEGALHLDRVKAKMEYREGNYEEAAHFQELYVTSLKAGNSEAWKFLGDIYQLMNRPTDSRNAYVSALKSIHENLFSVSKAGL